MIDERILQTWRRHNDVLLLLLGAIPTRGLTALPAGSRGRDVSRVFAHLDRVRQGWLQYFLTGKQPKLPRYNTGAGPGKAQLRKMLVASGKAVERFLGQALAGTAKSRYFGGDPVRWMGYLIAHESHHRGQIMLALKQSGMKLSDKVALEGLWGKWIMGR